MAYVYLDLDPEGVSVSELRRKGAVEPAALIRDREVSSRQVVQAHLVAETIEQRLGTLTPIDPGRGLPSLAPT
jgi:hypothetical protein